jgi:transcriptional regulator with PAS, ATPase and Fis domain
LPEQLAESELFGHRRGAFSGAEKSNTGLFRAADGGTLFLDEILELPRSIQAKLLRAIERQEVLPLGETQTVPVDVRIVTATQESLSAAVKDERFRADLLARLDGLTVVLPPLRERREDIVPLFLQFLSRQVSGSAVSLDSKLVESLCIYDWPLNVRELAILTRRLLDLHGQKPTLKRSHLPDRMQTPSQGALEATSEEPVKRSKQSTKDDAQFEALIAALREHEGNVAKAAAALGLNRHRAYRLLTARPDFSREKLGEKE